MLASPSLNAIFTPCSRAFVPAVPLPVMFFPQMFSGLTSLPPLGPSPSCSLLEMPSRSLPGTSHLPLLLCLSSKRLAPLEILYVWLIPLFLYFPQWSYRRRLLFTFFVIKGFPGSSASKESACSAGDPTWIPGSGRPPGEEIGYPLQYSWAPLVAQMVKNPPEM